MRAARLRLSCLAIGCMALAALPGLAATADPAPEVAEIVSRMEQAQALSHAEQQPYALTRDYQFFSNASGKPASEVVARVDFQPPNTKTFTVQKAQGSGQGEKIIRKVLEHEKAAAQDDSNDISRKNYDFKFLRKDEIRERPCYVLQLIPKHPDKTKIQGELWVDANTYLIHRIDGELAKSPSWWVKDVHVTLEFSSMAGMWLQTAMHAVANLHFLGQHILQSQNIDCIPASGQQSAPDRKGAPIAEFVFHQDGAAPVVSGQHSTIKRRAYRSGAKN